MSHITVVFTRRHHIGSVLIRTWMHSRFSHCAIIDHDRDTVIEAVVGGVRERPVVDLLKESSYFEYVTIPCDKSREVIELVRAQVGKPYDWKGVLGFWFRRNWRDDRAFFCSELIAWALEKVGQPAFRRGAHRISPEQLYLPIFNR